MLPARVMIVLSVDVGIVNMAFCVFRDTDKTILHWEVFEVRPVNRNLCRGLKLALDAHAQLPSFDLSAVDKVVVEAQPGRSKKMAGMQHWLEMYYTCHGKPVVIYSARHKLLGTGMENKGKGNYRARKKAAVHLATAWLQDNPQAPDLTAAFLKCKKADDKICPRSSMQVFVLSSCERIPLQLTISAYTRRLPAASAGVLRLPDLHGEHAGAARVCGARPQAHAQPGEDRQIQQKQYQVVP